MQAQPFPDSVARLLAAADDLPTGRARLEVLQQAVQIADSFRDMNASFWTRRQLIDEASFCLRYDLYATAFTWCLASARKEPTRFSLADLMGHYQHLIGRMVNFPNVTRDQYESLFADVVRELEMHGFSLRTAYLERRSVAIDFGDRAMAEFADCIWRNCPRDELSSREEFEMARHIDYSGFLADDLAAVRVSDEYFGQPWRNRRHEVWISDLSLLPLLRLGRAEEAAARFQTVVRAARTSGYDWAQSYRLEYLGLVGDFARGVRELGFQLQAALAQPDPLSRYYFLRPAALLLDKIAADGVRTVTLKAPPGVPWGESHGVYEVSAVRDWALAEALAIAAQFDRRNGNTFYADWLRRTVG